MNIGEIVISICGHDMGEWYIVKEISGNFVYLIDGKLKTLLKPKKKKIKHVIKTNQIASEIAQKLTSRQTVQDAKVRKTLKFFKNNFRSE